MKSARRLLSEHMNLPRWVTKHWDDRYVSDLIQSHALVDPIIDRQVWRILLVMRWKAAIIPYLKIIRLTWEVINGRYWRTTPKVHGSPAQSSGGSAGGAITSVTFTSAGAGYTGYGGAFSSSGTSAPVAAGGTFEDAGVRAGEVIAYRCWQLRDGCLYSAYRSEFLWAPKEIVEGDPEKLGEGIHAFKNRYDACAYIGFYEGDSGIIVSGTVELWGDVYEHARGYRASKAAIHSVDESPNYDAAALRKLYGLNRKKKKKAPEA